MGGSGRYSHTATLLVNGKVLVAGGQNSYGYLSSAELYDSSNGVWSDTGAMHDARAGYTATLLNNGKVLVAGGGSGNLFLNSSELYDPESGVWIMAASLNGARKSHSAARLANGKVLVAGGTYGSGYISSAELYDPSTGSYCVKASASSISNNAVDQNNQDMYSEIVQSKKSTQSEELLDMREVGSAMSLRWKSYVSLCDFIIVR